jgi:hypothetical protein
VLCRTNRFEWTGAHIQAIWNLPHFSESDWSQFRPKSERFPLPATTNTTPPRRTLITPIMAIRSLLPCLHPAKQGLRASSSCRNDDLRFSLVHHEGRGQERSDHSRAVRNVLLSLSRTTVTDLFLCVSLCAPGFCSAATINAFVNQTAVPPASEQSRGRPEYVVRRLHGKQHRYPIPRPCK